MQVALLRNVCGCLPVGTPAAAIFAEVAQDPCSLKWWVHWWGSPCGSLVCHTRERERERERELNSVHAASWADGTQWKVHVRVSSILSSSYNKQEATSFWQGCHMREREKFKSSIQPALAYEDMSEFESSAKPRMAVRQ